MTTSPAVDPGAEMALLRVLLARGACTPAQLAQALQIDAASVPVLVEGLRQLGVALTGGTDGTWQLAAPLDLLDVAALRAQLAGLPLHIELRDECASTNAVLVAQADAPCGSVLACEYQSAGRGRRGRGWHSGIGGALTFSLLWRFDCAPAALSGLSLAVAVMVAQGLESQGARGLRLKWPNDLLHEGRKLGGILIELPARASGAGARAGTACVIGIGLNVRLPQAVAQDIDRPVGDLAQTRAMPGAFPDRNRWLAAVLRELAHGLPRFGAEGFAAFREAWLERHAHAGREVSIELDGRSVLQGRAESVDGTGALLVRAGTVLQAVHSGEVSLRIK